MAELHSMYTKRSQGRVHFSLLVFRFHFLQDAFHFLSDILGGRSKHGLHSGNRNSCPVVVVVT